MHNAIQEFLNLPFHKSGPASRAEDIQRVEDKLGHLIPHALKEVWASLDGAKFNKREYEEFYGPSDLIAMSEDGFWGGFFRSGWLPVINLDNSWGCFMVDCGEVLSPRVLFVPFKGHELEIAFRTPEELFQHVCEAVRDERDLESLFFDDNVFYYRNSPERSASDIAAAKTLLATADDDETMMNLAINLLSDECVDEWQALLGTGHFVRRNAVAWLAKFDTEKAQAIWLADRKVYQGVTRELEAALKEAGLDVTTTNQSISVGGRHFMIDFYFEHRHKPSFVERAVWWIEDSLAGESPKDRKGNLLD